MTQTTTLSSQTSESYKRGKALVQSNETGAKKVGRERAKLVIEKATQKSQEQVVKSLAGLKLSVTEALDSISAQMTGELKTLKEVQEAIEAENTRLNELHQIVAEADSLQGLLLAQKTQRESFETEMTTLRQKWAEEKVQHQKDRQRDEDTYTYDLTRRRKVEADQHAEAQKAEREKFDADLETRGDALDVREKALLEKELELTTLRAQVKANDETLKKEVSREVAIATNSLKKDLNHEHALVKLNLENQLSQSKLENSQLQKRIEELLTANKLLDTEYKAASSKVQQIAERAIDGASQRQTVVNVPSQEQNDSRRK
jgi:hypothetical protein